MGARRSVRTGVVAGVLAAALVAVGVTAAQAAPPAGTGSCEITPTAEYPTATPDGVGLDRVELQAALDYASLNGSSTVKVFRHGCLAGQGLRDAALERVPELNAGQTKAVVDMVAGIVADRGWVDLDAPIGDQLPPDLGDADHRARTLRQLMTLTSGVQVNHVQGLNMVGDQARAREYFSQKLEHPAGEYFEFDETTPSVIVDVLQRAIDAHEPGVDFQDFTQRELFDPLGIPRSAYFWQRDRAGTTTGYSQLWLRALEYGRLGELLRGDGRFGGRQVLSASFVEQMRTGSEANCGFGLGVWLNSCEPGQTQVNTDYPSRREYPGEPWIESAPSDMYYSLGLGTNTFVIPSLDMVVTRSGYQEMDNVPGALRGDLHAAFPGNAGGPGEHEFFRLLMDAVTELPDDVRASIANSGPYDRPADQRVDVDPFVNPPTAGLGSATGLGPQGGEGCTPLGCAGEPNDGLKWTGDVPRVVPGVVGAQQRPGG